jgi:type II secretory pathway pseudopilin PulG
LQELTADGADDMRVRPETDTAGFTVLELMLAAMLVMILAGMAMIITPAVLARARADSGASALLAVLRTAREQAISQRRIVRVEFLPPDQVRVVRVDIPAGTTTLLDARLENGVQFLLMPGVPDTPDAFGAAAAIDFGTAATFNFTSEGTFVDQNGDVLNGTVFVAVPNRPDTQAAVTIFGPTADLHAWRWNGATWDR